MDVVVDLWPAVKGFQRTFLKKRILIPLSILPVLWIFLFRRTGKSNKNNIKCKKPVLDEDAEYELKNLDLPGAYGWQLKLFAKITTSVFGKLFLMPISKRKSNIHIFKTLCIPEKPTLFPLVPCDTKAVDVNNGELNFDLWAFLKPGSSGEFNFHTIYDFIDAYRSGKCTPFDVAQQAIAAIEACEERDPKMRLFIQSNKDAILEMATASTQRYRNNCPLSIFDGIPVAAKDEYRVAGYYCCEGTTFLGETLETEDSEAHLISKLRKGGAIILGVTNMHQLGIGITGCNPSGRHGTARNPYNPDYYCGGSSSGSGGAVAAGICPMALGVDGGGSTRIPASVCGVVGVKATFGRLTRANCFQTCDTVGYPGPLCTSVRDAAISYAFLAGPDPSSAPSMEQPPVSLEGFENTCLKGVKIGIDWAYFTHASEEVVQICSNAVKFLENECQAEIVDINIPELEEARVAHFITIISEIFTYTTKMRAEYYDEIAYDCKTALAIVDSLTAQEYFMAQKQRTRSMVAFEHLFKTVDCIITPTLPIAMAKIIPAALKTGLLDASFAGQIMRYMFLGNLIGIPCMSVPVGYGENNLPIGLQVMTKWWDEAMMFRVAHAAEGVLKTKNKPEVYFDLL